MQESTYSTPYLADKALTKIATLTTVFYGPYSEGLAMSKSQYGSTIYYLNKEGKTQFSIPGKDGFPCKDGRIKIKNKREISPKENEHMHKQLDKVINEK